MLDGVDPGVIAELHHSAEHVRGVRGIENVRARWIGHRLHAEADLVIDAALPVGEGLRIAAEVRESAARHVPALASLRLAFK
jgi:divalent metal cation (Fe/Co/Zn/Cd) transporter